MVSEKFHPGWEADIDGAPTPILRANVMFRAVRVPGGQHSVTMRYRPLGATLGAFVTLACLAGALLFIAKNRGEVGDA